MVETNKKTYLSNNNVTLNGRITTKFIFSHEIYGEKFYCADLEVKRLSDVVDVIPIIVSDRLIDITKCPVGSFVNVKGQYRSYNKHVDNRMQLILTVFVRELNMYKDEDDVKSLNSIKLEGYICKTPVYRMTPLGREIADVLIAVNRSYNKSDYIPCICWGRNARYISRLEIGDKIKIDGRIQSRPYQKHISDSEVINKVAYEVSANYLELVKDAE